MRYLFALYSLCFFTNCLEKKSKPPEAVTIESPKSVSNTYKLDDSTNFVITISKSGYNVSHLNKNYKFNGTYNLGNYIIVNKSQIDSTKIFVVVAAGVPYPEFKPIIDLLKKQGYFVFKIVTENDLK